MLVALDRLMAFLSKQDTREYKTHTLIFGDRKISLATGHLINDGQFWGLDTTSFFIESFQIDTICDVASTNEAPFCCPASGNGTQGSNDLIITCRPDIESEI